MAQRGGGAAAAAGVAALAAAALLSLVVSRTIWNPRGRMQQTALYRVDASRAGAPVITSTLTVDGAVTAARSVGGTATLTISNNLAAVADMALNDAQRRATPTGRLSLSGGFASPAATSTAAEANRRVLRATADGVWVPTYTLRRGGAGGNGTVVATGPLVPCARTYRPAAFAGFSLQSVVRVPVGEGAAAAAGAPTPAAAVAVASGGGAVYATATSLYVTTTAYGAARAASTTTAVHRFDTAGTSAAYVASGAVAGRLLNQFSLHERSGVLFVATTERANGTSSSTLTALKVRAPCYGCRPRLTPIGRLGGLGPDERIYAVRYVGTTAYIVTFRETDPLYAISLADPTRLVSLGALKIPGFSRYLHPLSPTLLLGLGQHANARGETEGAKASLFRVPVAAGGDGGGGGPPATALAELDTWKVPTNARGGSGFEAANDHLAFSWWPARQLVLAPWWRSTPQFSVEGGLTLLHVDPVAGTLTPWGTITHPAVESGRRSAAFIERVVVVRGRYLWSVSDGRVEVHDLDNRLARTGGVAFG